MTKLGEWVLASLSRDPAAPDYRVESYDSKHEDSETYK